MPCYILGLRKRTTSSDYMCYTFWAFVAHSAHRIACGVCSCLVLVVQLCWYSSNSPAMVFVGASCHLYKQLKQSTRSVSIHRVCYYYYCCCCCCCCCCRCYYYYYYYYYYYPGTFERNIIIRGNINGCLTRLIAAQSKNIRKKGIYAHRRAFRTQSTKGSCFGRRLRHC